MTISLLNNKGFTLIEVVVAMLIMLVGLMGLLQAVSVATEHNLRNQLRDEAVRIADQHLRQYASISFTNLTSHTEPRSITRNFRSGSSTFTVLRTVTGLPTATSPTSKQVAIQVGWTYKQKPYSHQINTIVAQ